MSKKQLGLGDLVLIKSLTKEGLDVVGIVTSVNLTYEESGTVSVYLLFVPEELKAPIGDSYSWAFREEDIVLLSSANLSKAKANQVLKEEVGKQLSEDMMFKSKIK